jgi:hypothetical protein
MSGEIYAYLGNFAMSIDMINQYFAYLINLGIEMKGKYGNLDEIPKDKFLRMVDDSDKQRLIKGNEETRFWTIQTYVRLASLKNKFKELSNNWDNIKTEYEHIKDNEKIDLTILEEFVVNVNSLLVEGIGAELLAKSSEYYSQLSQANVIR